MNSIKKKICLVITIVVCSQSKFLAQSIEIIAPGVWKVSFGTTENFKPSDFKEAPALDALKKLSDNEEPPFGLTTIKFRTTKHGCVVELTMDESGKLYGFGLQNNTFQQRGLRKEIHVNSWATGNVGFSHAPVPFYFRKNNIPCDMFGLELGWQSVAYSCSFEWESSLFPNPQQFIQCMDSMGFKLNLWEHAYVFLTSLLFDPLKDKSEVCFGIQT